MSIVNRKVKKFGKVIYKDDITVDELEKYFNNFIEEVRNKGYIPVREPKLDNNHYHFTPKGWIHVYEDGTIQDAITDEHRFFVRCIYLGKRKAHERDYLKVNSSRVRFIYPNKEK